MSELPNHREIDTPWEPEPIIWRDGRDIAHKEALKAFVKQPEHTHVVREVRVADIGRFGTTDLTLTQIEETIERTETEFERMADVGLNVTPREWHITQDTLGKHRTLARVAIVDGFRLSKQLSIRGINSLPEPQRSVELAYEASMERYYAQADEYEFYDGHNKQQYLFGRPRIQEGNPEALYLFDIEPVFFTISPDKKYF